MYLSPFTGRAYYEDTDEEREERTIIEANCHVCGEPVEAWYGGIDLQRGREPLYIGECPNCGRVRAILI